MNLNDLTIPPGAVPAPKPKRVPSPQQLAIYTAGETTPDNLLIEAVAGAGKSTTLIDLTERLPGSSLFLAFNKAIADDLRSKITCGEVRTLNALGHRVLMGHRRGAELNSYKTRDWVKNHASQDIYNEFAGDISRVVSVAKSSGLDIMEPAKLADFRDIVDRYLIDLDPDVIEMVSKMGQAAFHAVLANENEFDFDDQLYVPVKEGWTFPAFGNILVDEAQDLSPIQHMMLAKLADRGARIIAVGDRRQAIYAFRAAAQNSMSLLAQTFLMKEYPLSVTYRCSQTVTRLAQTITPQIQFRENAPEGSVKHLDQYPDVSSYSSNDMIVCRNNAPIFKMALQFVRARKPCRVFSNFLDQFEAFVKSFKAKEIPVLLERLELWYAKQRKDCEDKGLWGKLEGISDKYGTLKAFAPEFQTIPALLQAIYNLSTSRIGPKISTIHKAKGLEADNVYLLRWDLLPSTRATTPEAIAQEDNLRYVAITRARENLFILPLGD